MELLLAAVQRLLQQIPDTDEADLVTVRAAVQSVEPIDPTVNLLGSNAE